MYVNNHKDLIPFKHGNPPMNFIMKLLLKERFAVPKICWAPLLPLPKLGNELNFERIWQEIILKKY